MYCVSSIRNNNAERTSIVAHRRVYCLYQALEQALNGRRIKQLYLLVLEEAQTLDLPPAHYAACGKAVEQRRRGIHPQRQCVGRVVDPERALILDGPRFIPGRQQLKRPILQLNSERVGA
jgi:hypothetical protein